MKAWAWIVAGLLFVGVVLLYLTGQSKTARAQMDLARAKLAEPEVRALRKEFNARLARNEEVAEDFKDRIRSREKRLRKLYQSSGMPEGSIAAQLQKLRK